MGGIVVASTNGKVGIGAAVAVLRAGGSAVDAVLAGIAPVEANPDDHSVGYSGLPNLLGRVELDASIMEGRGLRAGAVGALEDYQDAAQLARYVMDDLPHVLIVGEGAGRYAAERGLWRVDLLTPEAREIWERGLERHGRQERREDARSARHLAAGVTQDPQLASEPPHGTVNFIARDRHGDLACGVSTSGWAWKYPGRLGDSPVIGAGNYADNRWGAAACTGRGEMAQRCVTAHSVVTFMRFGLSLEEAVRLAMEDLRHLDDPYASEMNVVALDREGNPCAASTAEGKTYVVQREDMAEWEERPRLHVPLVSA